MHFLKTHLGVVEHSLLQPIAEWLGVVDTAMLMQYTLGTLNK